MQLSYLSCPYAIQNGEKSRKRSERRAAKSTEVEKRLWLFSGEKFSACKIKVTAGQHGVYVQLSPLTIRQSRCGRRGRTGFIYVTRRCTSATMEIAPKRKKHQRFITVDGTYVLDNVFSFRSDRVRPEKTGATVILVNFAMKRGSVLSGGVIWYTV